MGEMRKRKNEDRLQSAEVDLGAGSAGQSGDLQGLPSDEATKLLEEGQSFDAGVVSGIENAPPADEGAIKTRQVPEDDVPLEYLDDERGNRSDAT
jgi:hypothetical protein